MRNKQGLIDDAAKVLAPEFKDHNVVEDAAFVMRHTQETKFVLPAEFTSTKKDEVFLFEKRLRPATDDPTKQVEDYFYIGRGE